MEADASGNAVSNPVDSTTVEQARELTAAELAGGTRPRRSRRPRRTPSQISTRSLPAYMKEPGDNEVVIYRYVFRKPGLTLDISHQIAYEQWPRRHGRGGGRRTSK